MTRLGIDYAWHGTVNPGAMRNAGATFAMRYLSHDAGKNLTRSEAMTLSRGGVDIGVVWETTANRALSGYNGGQVDATQAAQQAASCGMPSGRPIYFAVDFDASSGQMSKLASYYHGAASVLGKDRVGAYAGFWVIKYLFDHDEIAWGWQTYAWSGGHRDPRAQLYQFHNGVRVAGIDSDWNRAYATDFGQWKIGQAPDPQVPVDATAFNAPGEHHNDVWLLSKHEVTPLYFPNGSPTGQNLERSKLLYPDHEGRIQLDFKERVANDSRHFVFARGGYVPGHDPVPYGHVWVGDFANEEHLGVPVPAGDGRGAPAARTRLVTLNVQPVPGEMLYKPNASSSWATYGDAGAKYGYPLRYSYMLWSAPRTELAENPGGGMVRALVPNGGHLWLCNVARLHCASVDESGAQNGVVVLAYCERSDLYGWVVVAYQLDGQPMVHTIV